MRKIIENIGNSGQNVLMRAFGHIFAGKKYFTNSYKHGNIHNKQNMLKNYTDKRVIALLKANKYYTCIVA